MEYLLSILASAFVVGFYGLWRAWKSDNDEVKSNQKKQGLNRKYAEIASKPGRTLNDNIKRMRDKNL
jgi:hypothetical protein